MVSSPSPKKVTLKLQSNINLWTRAVIHFFPMKGDLEITKWHKSLDKKWYPLFPYQRVTSKLESNCNQPYAEKILRKIQNCFSQNRSPTLQILTIRRIINEVRAKNLMAIILNVDLFKTFDTIYRRDMG